VDQVKLRAWQYVRRFNFERCNRYQTVAEHSACVAALALDLARMARMPAGKVGVVLEMALLHDAPEAVTGDLPYLVRRSLDPAAIKELDVRAEGELGIDLSAPRDVIDVVSYADALELAMYLREERLSGNASLLDIERETRGRLVEFRSDGAPPHAPTDFFEYAVGLLGGWGEWAEVGIKGEHGGLKH